MVYSWRSYNYSVSAETVGHEFEKIEKEHGKITNDLVLQEATDENSPLHEMFEWDDSVAGHKYRLHQATLIIVSLAVEPEEVKTPKEVRAYYNVSNGERKGKFINMKSAFSNPDTKEIVLKRAFREFMSFKNKYSNIEEFSELFATFENTLSNMDEEFRKDIGIEDDTEEENGED